FDVFGRGGDRVLVLADAAAVDEAVAQLAPRGGVAHDGKVDQQAALVAGLERYGIAPLVLDVAGPLRDAGLPVVHAFHVAAHEQRLASRVLSQGAVIPTGLVEHRALVDVQADPACQPAVAGDVQVDGPGVALALQAHARRSGGLAAVPGVIRGVEGLQDHAGLAGRIHGVGRP